MSSGDRRPATAPALATDGLGRDYGSTRALDALTIAIEPGTIVGVLGPNGAGKTTALLLLATLLTPSRGTARVLGHDIVADRAAIRRRLGLLFQEASVDGLLTVEENLRFAARLAGLGGARAARAVDGAIARTGLERYRGSRASTLSGGWRRLVDVARATLHDPDLLILDEPTVGLDPEHRERVWSVVQSNVRERGTTVVFSTHYLAEAESADRAILLAGGVVAADDRPAGLRDSLGAMLFEIEGPDAAAAAQALRARSARVVVVRTERGFRVGVPDLGAPIGELMPQNAALTRFAVRPVTLEDVYFARTRPGQDVHA